MPNSRTASPGGCIPTKRYGANTAWQNLNILANNLLVGYQLATPAQSKPRSHRRTTVRLLESIRTVRFTWLDKAGRIVDRSGRRVLRLSRNSETERRYAAMTQKLHIAA
jgi:hypothetical protein